MGVIIRIQYPTAEVVVEVTNPIFGNASKVAARCRAEGLQARKVGGDVIVNGSAEMSTPRKG